MDIQSRRKASACRVTRAGQKKSKKHYYDDGKDENDDDDGGGGEIRNVELAKSKVSLFCFDFEKMFHVPN